VIPVNLINYLERKFYRIRFKPFYKYVVFAMGAVFILDLFVPRLNLSWRLSLIMPAVVSGEIWRLVTFLVVPPSNNPLSLFLMLYFYYFLGTALEARWGARRFFLFYAIGALGAIIGAVITGYGSNVYLNMSLFFAFALLYPDFQIMLFFILPIKMKWLALLNALFFLSSFVTSSWPNRAAILFSLANLFLFFGGDIVNKSRLQINHWKRKQQFRNTYKR
jgi:membrane associated rhomboid family serine protease